MSRVRKESSRPLRLYFRRTGSLPTKFWWSATTRIRRLQPATAWEWSPSKHFVPASLHRPQRNITSTPWPTSTGFSSKRDAVQVLVPAQEDFLVGDGCAGAVLFGDLVGREYLQFWRSLDHITFAGAGKIDPTIRSAERARPGGYSGQTFTEDKGSSLLIQAFEHVWIVDAEDEPFVVLRVPDTNG